jgi:peptidoglycan DL-endopeptidase CwlO
MKKFIGSVILIMFCGTLLAQNRKIDKLEVNFAQGHYKRTYRQANRLLDKPEYDFSMLPTFYKSISMFELCQNKHWMLRRDEPLVEAEKLFLEVKYSVNGDKIFNAHMYEISWLKNDMVSWASDMKRMGHQEFFEDLTGIINRIFDAVPAIDAGNNVNEIAEGPNRVNISSVTNSARDGIISSAKQHIGTPYVWAGSSPDGFDCSGFTLYVMKAHGESIPRRAADQYQSSKKLKAKNVQKGDLVFFNNGSGISHVGIVVSELGDPLKMIHSSSSKGIIITNVEESKYWTQRLHGYGTYVN